MDWVIVLQRERIIFYIYNCFLHNFLLSMAVSIELITFVCFLRILAIIVSDLMSLLSQLTMVNMMVLGLSQSICRLFTSK